MSDNPAEKSGGFERWVASLKLGKSRPTTDPPGEDGESSPLSLDEQATLINRIPKEVIYKLRERDSQRSGMPKSEDSTAVFTPPPELLARARRFQAPPKPEQRSSPTASAPPGQRPPPSVPRPGAHPPRPGPPPSFDVAEAAAFASLNSDEEATTYFKPDIAEVPPSVPPPALLEQNSIPTPLAPPLITRMGTDGIPTPLVPPPDALSGDISRPGDIGWIDGLPSAPPPALLDQPPPSVPMGGSIAPAERRLRWIAVVVAIVLIAGILVLSRLQ